MVSGSAFTTLQLLFDGHQCAKARDKICDASASQVAMDAGLHAAPSEGGDDSVH